MTSVSSSSRFNHHDDQLGAVFIQTFRSEGRIQDRFSPWLERKLQLGGILTSDDDVDISVFGIS